MNYIALPPNLSGFFKAQITAIARELSRWRNREAEVAMLMGRGGIFFRRVGEHSAPAAAMTGPAGKPLNYLTIIE